MFTLTKSQRGFQKAAVEFAKGEFDKEEIRAGDRAQRFPTRIWQAAGELGFIGMHFPEEFAGQSLGLMDTLLVVETLCRLDSTAGGALALSGFAAESILKCGTREMKTRFLPMIAEGHLVCGAPAAMTDSATGVPLARKTGDGWTISGEVPRVVNAGLAGVYCLPCTTDRRLPAEKAVGMFLVPADSEGLSVDTPVDTLGLRMTPIGTLRLNDVRVTADGLLGKVGAGIRQFSAFLTLSRLLYAAMALGTAQGASDRGLSHIKKRRQFGRKIAGFQVTAHKMADMATRIMQARCLLYQAAAAADRGRADAALSAMANLAACNAAVTGSSEAIQLMGGYGYTTEYDVERSYRDAKALQLFAAPPSMLKDEIARSEIGRL